MHLARWPVRRTFARKRMRLVDDGGASWDGTLNIHWRSSRRTLEKESGMFFCFFNSFFGCFQLKQFHMASRYSVLFSLQPSSEWPRLC